MVMISSTKVKPADRIEAEMDTAVDVKAMDNLDTQLPRCLLT